MKYKLIIDPDREESLELILKERAPLADEIERLIGEKREILGYYDYDIYRLSPDAIDCVYTDGDDIFALCGSKKFRMRMRLYELEEMLGESFVKLNRGCIVRVASIAKFDSSLGGSLSVVLKNGFSDYISRRELKNVKRRFGL